MVLLAEATWIVGNLRGADRSELGKDQWAQSTSAHFSILQRLLSSPAAGSQDWGSSLWSLGIGRSTCHSVLISRGGMGGQRHSSGTTVPDAEGDTGPPHHFPLPCLPVCSTHELENNHALGKRPYSLTELKLPDLASRN